MISITTALRRLTATADAGLSLIEVLVAISIVTIVATASGTLVLNGIAAGATIERRQVAVTIASSTMESISAQSVAKNSITGVSALYTGRNSVAVLAAWAANSTVAGVLQTTAAFDPTATGSATPAIPLASATTQAGTTYTVQALIGSCLQPTDGGDCKVATLLPSTSLIRAIVIVKWTAGKTCATGCSYVTSTMIDPNQDLDWVTHG